MMWTKKRHEDKAKVVVSLFDNGVQLGLPFIIDSHSVGFIHSFTTEDPIYLLFLCHLKNKEITSVSVYDLWQLFD